MDAQAIIAELQNQLLTKDAELKLLMEDNNKLKMENEELEGNNVCLEDDLRMAFEDQKKLREDVRRFNAYHLESERQHEITKEELEKTQDINARCKQREKQYDKSIYQLQVKIERIENRESMYQATIHGLQEQVDTLTNQNTLLEIQVNQMQNEMFNLEDLEEELEENPEVDEAIGDGEVLDD